MFNTYKDKNSDIFGVSYASCGPTIVGGGWQGSGQGVSVPLLQVSSVPAATLPLLFSLYNNNKLYKKRGLYRVFHGIYNKERERSSQRTKVSPKQ